MLALNKRAIFANLFDFCWWAEFWLAISLPGTWSRPPFAKPKTFNPIWVHPSVQDSLSPLPPLAPYSLTHTLTPHRYSLCPAPPFVAAVLSQLHSPASARLHLWALDPNNRLVSLPCCVSSRLSGLNATAGKESRRTRQSQQPSQP